MKAKVALPLALCLALAPLALQGGLWIKNLGFGSRSLIYESQRGSFASCGQSFSIFNPDGSVEFKGQFKTSEGEAVLLDQAIRLDDGTFVGFYRRQINEEFVRNSHYLLRFTREGEVLFAKKLWLPTASSHFALNHMIQFGDQVKIVCTFDFVEQWGFQELHFHTLWLISFSREGKLLRSRQYHDTTGRFTYDSNYTRLFPIDADHYGVAISGSFQEQNGILLMSLDQDDMPARVKLLGHDPGQENVDKVGFGRQAIHPDADGGFSILQEEVRTIPGDPFPYGRDFYFFKLDSDWSLKWSRRYRLDLPFDGYRTSPAIEIDGGYALGITCGVKESEHASIEGGTPLILKVKSDGTPQWCKKYSIASPGSESERIDDMILLPNGAMAAAGNVIHCLLNKKGQVSESCPVPQDVGVNSEAFALVEEERAPESFRITGGGTDIQDAEISFVEEDTPTVQTFCQLDTFTGSFRYVEERSILKGRWLLRLDFSLTPSVVLLVKRFRVYKKSPTDSEYTLLSEFNKVGLERTYKLYFDAAPLRNCSFRVEALDASGVVLDLLLLK